MCSTTNISSLVHSDSFELSTIFTKSYITRQIFNLYAALSLARHKLRKDKTDYIYSLLIWWLTRNADTPKHRAIEGILETKFPSVCALEIVRILFGGKQACHRLDQSSQLRRLRFAQFRRSGYFCLFRNSAFIRLPVPDQNPARRLHMYATDKGPNTRLLLLLCVKSGTLSSY